MCLSASIGLIVGGFLTPPKGVIDGSVLTATGIIFAFAALGIFAQAIEKGKFARIKKNDIEVTVGDNDEN